MDPKGYVLTDGEQKTTVDGVYAAGDLCVKSLRQVVTATADGAIAATAALKYCGAMHRQLKLPKFPPPSAIPATAKKNDPTTVPSPHTAGTFLTAEIRGQVEPILAKITSVVTLQVHGNDTDLSKELQEAAQEIAALSEKIKVQTVPQSPEDMPYLSLLKGENTDTGIAFHGVPGGHEFTSFILALYNVAGPGQEMDEETKTALADIDATGKKIAMKVLVSLSCTMCPAVVQETQRLAAASSHITAEMFDLQHFPKLKNKYRVMSVPCLVINDHDVHFGKKSMHELLQLLKNV